MASFNKVILMGNLTANPELRYTPQGTAVTDLRLAVNNVRGRGAERKEDTVFVDVTVWDRQAETCNEYLSKGRSVMIEGRLQMDQWEDKESGQKRSKLRVVAQNVQFVGGRGDEGGEGEGAPRQAAPRQAGGRPGGSRPSQPATPSEPFDDDFGGGDDIPF